MYEYLKMLYKASRLEISDVYILHSSTPTRTRTHTHKTNTTHAAAVARNMFGTSLYKIEKHDFRLARFSKYRMQFGTIDDNAIKP